MMRKRMFMALGLIGLTCVGCSAISGQKRASLYQAEIDRLSAEKAILERELRSEQIRRERAEAIVMADRANRPVAHAHVGHAEDSVAPTPRKTPTRKAPLTERPKSVKEIQTALVNAGYKPGPVDGKLGPRTKTAIIAFQKDMGLKADGVVGRKTWGKLGIHLNASK